MAAQRKMKVTLASYKVTKDGQEISLPFIANVSYCSATIAADWGSRYAVALYLDFKQRKATAYMLMAVGGNVFSRTLHVIYGADGVVGSYLNVDGIEAVVLPRSPFAGTAVEFDIPELGEFTPLDASGNVVTAEEAAPAPAAEEKKPKAGKAPKKEEPKEEEVEEEEEEESEDEEEEEGEEESEDDDEEEEGEEESEDEEEEESDDEESDDEDDEESEDEDEEESDDEDDEESDEESDDEDEYEEEEYEEEEEKPAPKKPKGGKPAGKPAGKSGKKGK